MRVDVGMVELVPWSCQSVGGRIFERGFLPLRIFAGTASLFGRLIEPAMSSFAGRAVSSAAIGSGRSAGSTSGIWSGKTQSMIGLFTAAAPIRLSPRQHSVRASVVASDPPSKCPYTPIRDKYGR